MSIVVPNGMGSAFVLADLGAVTGPFFLGFMMEGIVVVVLALNYLSSVAQRRKLPSESPRRMGVILVIATLVVTTGQTIMDLYRGYRMFGTDFMNIAKFLTPDALWFWSPFLGIISGVIAQCFLLRRIIRFLSSLEVLWPILSRKLLKYTFAAAMSFAIFLAALAGNLASAKVRRSGGVATLGLGGVSARSFQILSGVWLGTAVAVDCVLCAILCVELWWARRKLSMKGTTMQEFMTRLILVTFQGGAAVTGLQTATLLLYYYQRTSSWCYFPMILLPKVYSITLILSISLPQTTAAQAPSAMISLPTIHPDPSDSRDLPTPQGPTRASRRRSQPHRIHFETGAEEVMDTSNHPKEAVKQGGATSWTRSAPNSGTRWSEVFKSSWRRSQGLLSWSLVPGDGAVRHGGRSDDDTGKWLKVDKDPEGTPRTPRPASAPQARRPSLMPLLTSSPSPPTARRLHSPLSTSDPLIRSNTLPTPHSARRDRFDPSSISSQSTFQTRRDSLPRIPTTPIPYPQPTYSSPSPRGPASDRQSSFSIGSPIPRTHRRSTVPALHDPPGPYVLPLPVIRNPPDPESIPDFGFHFDTVNPFGSIYSGSQVSLQRYPPNGSSSHMPLGSMYGPSTSTLPDRGLRPTGRVSKDGPDADDEEETRLALGRRDRNMSFQDFLADGPDSPPEIEKVNSQGREKG